MLTIHSTEEGLHLRAQGFAVTLLAVALLIPTMIGSAPAAASPLSTRGLHAASTSPLRVNITEATTQGTANMFQNLTANATGGSPPYAYLWSTGQTGPGPVPASLYDPGNFTYTVVASDSVGTTAAAYYHITVSPPGRAGNAFDLSATAAFLAPTSTGAIVAFSCSYSGNVTPMQSFSWEFGDGGRSYAQDPTHTFNSSGEYHVIVSASTNASYTGGTSASYALDVLVQTGGGLALGVARLAWDVVYRNGSFEDAFDFEGAAVGGTPPYHYLWSFGDGIESGPMSNASVNHTYIASTSTRFVATLTVVDSVGRTWGTALAILVARPPISYPPSMAPMAPTPPPLFSTVELVFVGAWVAVASVVIVVVVRRRRSRVSELGGAMARMGGGPPTGRPSETREKPRDQSGAVQEARSHTPVTTPEQDLLADVL